MLRQSEPVLRDRMAFIPTGPGENITGKRVRCKVQMGLYGRFAGPSLPRKGHTTKAELDAHRANGYSPHRHQVKKKTRRHSRARGNPSGLSVNDRAGTAKSHPKNHYLTSPSFPPLKGRDACFGSDYAYQRLKLIPMGRMVIRPYGRLRFLRFWELP